MGNPYPITPVPTLAGFTAFLYGVVGIPAAWLPSDSPTIGYAYNTAYATVNTNFQSVPGPIYLQMIYQLGTHLELCWQQDPSWTSGPVTGDPPKPYVVVDDVAYGFFGWQRKSNNILGFITGIVNSSGDEGTSVGLVTPRQFENLTVDQLQLTTTPWGRFYLGKAMAYGTNWGLS